MRTCNWDEKLHLHFYVYARVKSKKSNNNLIRWLSYIDLEVQMKCTKIFYILLLPLPSQRLDYHSNHTFFETVIEQERRDLDCFESDRLVILHVKKQLLFGIIAKIICFVNRANFMKVYQLKSNAHSLISLPWKFDFHIYHSSRE